jgi:hypothetical protein
MSERLFSYGTLQFASVQQALFGRHLDGSADTLIGFDLIEIEVHDPEVLDMSGVEIHAALVPAEGDSAPIAGVVFELSSAELAAADVYETENYRRVEVTLASGRRSWVYVKA